MAAGHIGNGGCHHDRRRIMNLAIPPGWTDGLFLTSPARLPILVSAMRTTIITIQRSFIILGLILSAVLNACSALPDYARPRGGVQLDDPTLLDDAFTYRQLTRSDFKAAALPADRLMHESSINAHTCTHIRPTPDSRFKLQRADYQNTLVFIGTIESISFEAVMIPGCSWWNPVLPPARHAYVLQHEQIHFALVELTARRLTDETRDAARAFMAIHSNAEATRAEIAATINGWIRDASDKSLAEHTAFDKDTSLFHSPRWQQWWQEKVERQLAEIQPVTMEVSGKNAGYNK